MAPQRLENAHQLFGGTCNHYLQGHVFKAKKWPDCAWLETCLFRTAPSGPIGIMQQHFDKLPFCSNSKVIWMVIIKTLGAKTDCYPHGPRHCPNPACLVAQICLGSGLVQMTPIKHHTKHFRLSQCHSFFTVRKLYVVMLVIYMQHDQELTPSTDRCVDIWALQTGQRVLWDCMCM